MDERIPDWIDRRFRYFILRMLTDYEGTFWEDNNPINMIILPLWLIREIYRAIRNR
jgi:hypothetical protein